MTHFPFFWTRAKKNPPDCWLSTHRPCVFSPSSMARCSQKAPPPTPVFKNAFGFTKKLQPTQKWQNTESRRRTVELLCGATRWASWTWCILRFSFEFWRINSFHDLKKKRPPFCLIFWNIYSYTIYPEMFFDSCLCIYAREHLILMAFLSHSHFSWLGLPLFLDSLPVITSSTGSFSRRSLERKRRCN